MRARATAALLVTALAVSGPALGAETASRSHALAVVDGQTLWLLSDGERVPLEVGAHPQRNYDAIFPLHWTADGEEVSYADGTVRYTVDVRTGEERGLIPAPASSLAPDERAAAVTRDGALYVEPLGPGQSRRVAGGGDDPYVESGETASWDAQSRWLAFTARRLVDGRTRGPWRLFMVADDGTGLRRLVAEEAVSVYGHEWSPDGTALAVRVGLTEVDPAVVDVATGTHRLLADVTGDGRTVLAGPTWSPDGRRLAFVTVEADREVWEIRLHVTSDVGQPLATYDLALPDSPRGARGPSWSPDGMTIAFTTSTDDSGDHQLHWNVFTVDVASGDLQQLDAGGDGTYDPDELLVGFGPGTAIRRAGATRVQTAATISRTTFATAEHVVIGRADLYPDALAGAPLAAGNGAPLLLTPSTYLHDTAAAEIERLGATTAWLLGSEGALSRQVHDDLRALGVTDIRRLAGDDRFDTARLVAGEVGGTRVFVVEGRNADPNRGWPDAVAVSGLAAMQQRPILLVETNRLPDATAHALDELGATHVTIVGGPPAVSTRVEDQLRDRGLEVDRLHGEDRYATSLAVARHAVGAGGSAASTWFATGRNWPDALGTGPAVAASGGVLLLVDGARVDGGATVAAWLDEHGSTLRRVTLTGGPDVLSPGVDALVEASTS